MRLPKWMDTDTRFEDGHMYIVVNRIKWWGWAIVFLKLVKKKLTGSSGDTKEG